MISVKIPLLTPAECNLYKNMYYFEIGTPGHYLEDAGIPGIQEGKGMYIGTWLSRDVRCVNIKMGAISVVEEVFHFV